MKILMLAAALLIAQPDTQTSVIRSLKFENFKGISMEQVTERLKDRGIRVTVEQIYDPAQIDSAKQALKELLEEKGRSNMEVTSSVRQIPPRSVEVTFKAVKTN